MKIFFQSKFGWALMILIVAGSIGYLTTWGNRNWLIDKIIDNGGVSDTTDNRKALALKTSSALRSQLKGLM